MRNFKIIRKTFTLLLSTILVVTGTVFADETNENIIKKNTYSPLTGVWVSKISTIENGGFFDYQVVECDLTNPNIQLDLLYPSEGGNTLKPTRAIGEENGAAVIVNADYFNRSDGANEGSAVGYNQKDGKLLSNALEEQVYSFSYKDDNQYSFDIFSNQIKIGFRGEVFEFVKTYNKYSSLEGVAIFDSHWGKESLGSHGTLVELVIEDHVLTEIRRDMPPAEIPENGFVLAGLSDLTTLFDQVQVGDAVTLEIITTPQLAFLPDFTVGGGSLLVERGEIVKKMSYPKYSTSFPAIGISEDGKTLWMITAVNQNGLNLQKMAELCKAQGAYYAVALDGGGSTQCAVKNNETGELEYIHPLSGGYERAIANGVGIVPQSETPKAYGIHTEDTITFKNIPKKLSYTVYNENGDPMQVDPSEVSLSLREENGRIENGFYYADNVSTQTVLLSYEGVTSEMKIRVVSPALYATKNKEGTYTVLNADGYQRIISAEEYQNSRNITLVETLPTVDAMADDVGLPKALSVYGGRKSYDTLWDKLFSEKVMEKNRNTIYPFRAEQTEHPDIEIITVDNLEGQIINSRMTEWNRFVATLQTEKNNIIICLEDSISFSRQQEEDLFFELLSEASHRGKNILVLHRGDKTELKSIKDGVRILSVAYDTHTTKSFLETPSQFLTIHYNSNQMTYEIVSNQLFYPRALNEDISPIASETIED